jgi:hypothetical protein
MKNLKIFFLTLLSITLFAFSNQRIVILALSAAGIFAATSQVHAYPSDDTTSEPPPTPEQQAAAATQPAANPAVSIGSTVVGGIVSVLSSSRTTRSLSFKDPLLSIGTTYRSTDDEGTGGFASNEVSGDVSFDFEIYNGLILGGLYQHTEREGQGDTTSFEDLASDAFSVYLAKRFWDAMNFGVAGNLVLSEHDITDTVPVVDLDRTSYGATVFVGASNKHGKWNWSTTPSLSIIRDDYHSFNDINTGVFNWMNTLSYDVNKWFTLGAAGSYTTFVIQEAFSNVPNRDSDYWNIGPRLRFFPCDRATINFEVDSQQGFINYTSLSVRLSAQLAF